MKIVFLNIIIICFSLNTSQRNHIWKGSLNLWIDTVKKSPYKARPHNSLGSAYFEEGMFDNAILEYRKALEIDPNSATGHYNLGRSYDKKSRLDEAISEYKKALVLKPRYALAHNNLGVDYYLKGNYELAIIHCDKAIELGYNVNIKFLELLKPYR